MGCSGLVSSFPNSATPHFKHPILHAESLGNLLLTAWLLASSPHSSEDSPASDGSANGESPLCLCRHQCGALPL